MSDSMSRRRFLACSTLGTAALASGCATVPRPRAVPANSKLAHACIGVDGMGGSDLGNFLNHPRLQVVALCDVDADRLARAAQRVPGARTYTDWRELLAAEGDRIDSVNVATPDHMHAAIELPFLRAGKHVYGQKPLAHDVAECRALTQAARRAGVVTQLGTQHASGMGDRLAVKFLQAGLIGRVKHVYLCSNRPGIEAYRLAGPRPAQGEPPPASLNWDHWLGTAPERPYARTVYHPAVWRCWQDFGTGWSGDIGCHIFDAVWKGLGLTAPIAVHAEVQTSWRDSAERRGDTWPQSNHITWTFPGNPMTDGKELPVEWFDGEFYPPADVQQLALGDGVNGYPAESAMIIGTEGAMLVPHQSGPILLPREKYKGTDRTLPKAPNHYHRFVEACLGGEPSNSPFEIAGPMAEAIILGTVAIRVPETLLHWDAKRLRVKNSELAQQLVRRTYRSGWAVDLTI